MKERNATSEVQGQSPWDLFPSEHSEGRVPAPRRSPGAVAPPPRADAAVPLRRALPERESLRQWIVGSACDLLMSLAIAMARVSNMTSALRLPSVRPVAGEGLVVMTGAMLGVVVLLMTGSPARVASPEVLQAAASSQRVEAGEIAMAGGSGSQPRMSDAPSRRSPARESATRSSAAPVRAGASAGRAASAKDPDVESDVTTDVPSTRETAIATTMATAAVPTVDLPAAAAPSAARSGPEATALASSIAAPLPAASPIPTASTAVTAAVPASTPSVRPRSAAVQSVLNRYRDAFSALDPAAAKAVWPSADASGLGKAFDRLQEQQMVLDTCHISVIGVRATASCEGSLRYVPNVGSRSPRVQRGRWDFTLREVGDDWRIETVKAR